jgi:hypothetical protein
MNSTENQSDPSRNWLIFFVICFWLVMGIGIWAVFCYNCNAPESKPGGGGHAGMILPFLPVA